MVLTTLEKIRLSCQQDFWLLSLHFAAILDISQIVSDLWMLQLNFSEPVTPRQVKAACKTQNNHRKIILMFMKVWFIGESWVCNGGCQIFLAVPKKIIRERPLAFWKISRYHLLFFGCFWYFSLTTLVFVLKILIALHSRRTYGENILSFRITCLRK